MPPLPDSAPVASPPVAARPRLIVAITGATGAVYGLRLLQVLRESDVDTHLLVSSAGWLNIRQEIGLERGEVESLATVTHSVRDVGASIASGSFATMGMVIAPCSMKTLAAVAHGMADNLITRAADVTLKERRRLVMMVRETPLNLAHIRNMEMVTLMGGVIFPPVPAFYQRPASIADLVDHTIGRVLDMLGLPQTLNAPWLGLDLRRERAEGQGTE